MTSKEISSNGPEPYFLPAAFCSVLAPILLATAAASNNRELAFLSVFIWGASLALWQANGKAGGGTPWPRSMEELVEMANTLSQKNTKPGQ